MKKIFSIIMALTVVFCMAACSSIAPNDNGGNDEVGACTETITIQALDTMLADPEAALLD